MIDFKTALCISSLMLASTFACRTPAPVPPTPDANDAAMPTCITCTCACAHIIAIGCKWGDAATCPTALGEIESERIRRGPDGSAVTCAALVRAQSADDVRGLGLACAP